MENEWKTICASTKAKVHRSYVKDGITYSSEKVLNGTPQEVKKQLAPTYPGEVVELQHVHTMITQEREFHSPTTHGVVKEREERTLQVYGFGDKDMNKKFMGTENPTSGSPKGFYDPSKHCEQPLDPFPSEPGNEHKTRTLKNIYDKLSDRVDLLMMGLIGVGIASGIAIGISLFGLI